MLDNVLSHTYNAGKMANMVGDTPVVFSEFPSDPDSTHGMEVPAKIFYVELRGWECLGADHEETADNTR